MNILAYVHLRNIHGSTGAGRVARQMVEHLLARGEDRIEILGDRRDHATVIPKVGPPWDSCRYHLFNPDTSQQQARWILLHRPGAETFWPEVQVVYCAAESYVPTRRARLVVTMHDAALFERHAHRAAGFSLQRLKWRCLHKTLERKADLFHTVSDFSAERLAHFFPGMRNRLRVVHNGVAPRFLAGPSARGDRAVQEAGLAGRAFVLLPGGFHYRKNADLALAAWPSIRRKPGNRDLLLVVAGNNDPDYVHRAESAGDPSIRILGRVDDEVLCSLYHSARVAWVPSRYEGFGLTVLEAMACGAPVVASDSSSLPEIAGDSALFAAMSDTDAHVEAVHSVLHDETSRNNLIKRGRRRAAMFAWEEAAAKLRGEFLSLV